MTMAADGETIDTEASGENTGEERAVVLNTKPLFKLMVDKRASDLFFTSYAPIKIKIEGQIFPVNKQMLTPEVVRQAAYGLMTQEQIDAFNDELEIDFAFPSPASAASASTYSTSAAIRRWCFVTSPPTCRASTISACRRSSKT